MPCLSILWFLVADGWLVWDLWLTLKWKVKLSLKSSMANEAGSVTGCACITCFLQWSACSISSLHSWMLRPVPSSFWKPNRILYWCSFLKNWHKHRASVHWVWSQIYLHECKSKAVLYNSVEVMPVGKWWERKIGFVQCSVAISPLKQLVWTNEWGSKSPLLLLLGISLRERGGPFMVCILHSAIKWVGFCSCSGVCCAPIGSAQADNVFQPGLAAILPYRAKTFL